MKISLHRFNHQLYLYFNNHEYNTSFQELVLGVSVFFFIPNVFLTILSQQTLMCYLQTNITRTTFENDLDEAVSSFITSVLRRPAFVVVFPVSFLSTVTFIFKNK